MDNVDENAQKNAQWFNEWKEKNQDPWLIQPEKKDVRILKNILLLALLPVYYLIFYHVFRFIWHALNIILGALG